MRVESSEFRVERFFESSELRCLKILKASAGLKAQRSRRRQPVSPLPCGEGPGVGFPSDPRYRLLIKGGKDFIAEGKNRRYNLLIINRIGKDLKDQKKLLSRRSKRFTKQIRSLQIRHPFYFLFIIWNLICTCQPSARSCDKCHPRFPYKIEPTSEIERITVLKKICEVLLGGASLPAKASTARLTCESIILLQSIITKYLIFFW